MNWLKDVTACFFEIAEHTVVSVNARNHCRPGL